MSRTLPSREEFLARLNEVVLHELEAVERVSTVTREEVTSDETRSEGKYDTRATEASYLARGQAWRIAELRQLVAWCSQLSGAPPSERRACLGSLLLAEAATSSLYFLAPVGGTRVRVQGKTVRLVSPQSPIGQALLGLEIDDETHFESPTGPQSLVLLELC
jgi:transcription elongation GreA/GreB family factor